MKHLRLFENYKSDEEIHKICRKYKIKNYTINKDGSVDVNGDVDLTYDVENTSFEYRVSHRQLTKLPLIFNIVDGDFNCSDNKLTTLKGSPRIVKEDFWCLGNKLTNLIGGPEEVNGIYACGDNDKLTSLEGMAKIINDDLYIYDCNLSDFKGVPEDIYIGKEIAFYNNPVYDNLIDFLSKYNIDIDDIKDKYLDLILEINELDAIQDGKIIDIRMDEVLYNIGLI